MKLLIKYLKQYRKLLILALFLAAVNQVFSLLDPQIFRLMIDNYALRAAELSRAEFLRGVIWLLLGSVGVAFVSRVAKSFQDYFTNVITQRLGARLYADSVQHSFGLPFTSFEDQRSGELLQILRKARDESQALIQGMINTLFLSLVGILFVVIYAFYVHPLAGLGYFLIIPVLGIINFFISRKIKDIQKRIVAETAELSGSTTETLHNVELVKSLGLEGQEVQRLNEVNEKILNLELTKVKLVRKLSFIQGTTINALRSLLILLLFWLIFAGGITVGEYFSLFVYSFFVFTPLAELGNLATKYYETQAAAERLHEVLSLEPEVKPLDGRIIDDLKEISFDQVSFAYKSGTRPALSGVNLQVQAGETVAFVGPSGSGKSTAVKVISGLYQSTKGRLLVNGLDARQVNYDRLKLKLGLVAQETQLFAGTIRENLLFVKPRASDQECLQALKQASASSILERASAGLETKIGEGGLKLSGGERQRLAIARALLREPELIIFDEATSSLDSLTEKEIITTIKEIAGRQPQLMMIIVAHRLSTIQHADRIYVFEHGQIAEVGSHSELLKLQGLYQALWREQMASNG